MNRFIEMKPVSFSALRLTLARAPGWKRCEGADERDHAEQFALKRADRPDASTYDSCGGYNGFGQALPATTILALNF
jgi:hypothetical protein